MRIRALAICVVCSLLIGGAPVIGSTTHKSGSSYTPHSAIYIDGNEDFVAVNGVTGGGGTASDPYVIEGWEIKAGKVNGITIRQTSAHFVIRNVFVYCSELMYHGISFMDLVNGRVERSNISENWKGINILASSNVVIEDNNLTDNEEGMYIRDSHDISINGNLLEKNGPHDGLVVVASSNISIRSNSIQRNDNVGAVVSSSSKVYILQNDVRMNRYEGIRVGLSDDISLAGNVYENNPTGLTISSSANVSVFNCKANRNVDQGMYFDSASHITVDMCEFIDNDWYGVAMFNSENVSIRRTLFRTNRIGTFISNSRYVQLIDSIPFSNSAASYVEASSNLTFEGNDVADNWMHGISAVSSDGFRFSRNRFHSNNVDGIRLDNTANATITDNIFSENMRGMYLENSVGIIASHNEFKDNTNQARDNKGTENTWDLGYPVGGNYWNDYLGTDIFKGPYQNESNADGIGDVPYVIDSNSQDHYPLMSPPWGLPSAPEDLQASWGDGYVNLSWSAPIADGGFPVTSYRIYRRAGTGAEVHIADKPWVHHFNDTTVSNGIRHYYRVSAVNGVGEGPKSNEATSIPTAVPMPPADMKAVLSGTGRENVAINWSLSTDDGSGQGSVVEYKVFRGSNFSSVGNGYQVIASLPNGTFGFEDLMVGEGDALNYFYRVCAVDVNNKTRCSEDQVGKFTRALTEGPNLVSVPLLLEDSKIHSVLGGIPYSEAWFFDSVNKRWNSIVASKPYGQSATTIAPADAFWLNVTKDSSLTVAGRVPSDFDIQIVAGWNLIGFPSFGHEISVGQMRLWWNSVLVEGYDPWASPYRVRRLQGTDSVQIGLGYWVWVESTVSFHLG